MNHYINQWINKHFFKGCSCLYKELLQWKKEKSLFHQIVCSYESVMVISRLKKLA